jgi:hypothetical protein
MFRLIGLAICFVISTSLFEARAQPPSPLNNGDNEWGIPVQVNPDQPLRIAKYSGISDSLSLQVNALQKVLAPLDGTLLYSGVIERNRDGFVILHSDGMVSVISAPFSWEESTQLQPGSFIQKGEVIAVVRGGRAEVMRSLQWNVYKTDDQELLKQLNQLIVGYGLTGFHEKKGLYLQLTLAPQLNTKSLLRMGSYQLDVQAGNSQGCNVLTYGQQMTCAFAEMHDFLVPVGLYNLTLETGTFFKKKFVSTHYVSSPDTIVQSILKDETGNFVLGSYDIKLSESRKLPDPANYGDAMKLAEAVVRDRFNKTLLKDEIENQALNREIEKSRDSALLKQKEEQEIKNELEKKAREAQQKEQLRLAQEVQQKEQASLAAEVKRQAALELAQTEQAQQLERERLTALALEQTRIQKEDEARKKDAIEMARVNAELQKLRAQLAQTQTPIALPAVAEANAGVKNRKALILGNDSYKDVPVLLNARSDAKAISASLARSGFEVSMHLDLTERGMKEAIRNFKTQIKGGDEVVMYFAGHGVQLGATNYLLPVDIRGQSEDQVRDEAIPLQRLLDDIQDTKARFALAIIDACRDNPFKTAGRTIGGRGLSATAAATGQMVMFSAGTGQQALDRLGPNDKEPNGLFTRVLLKEMEKPGVSIERLVRNVRNEVARLSKSVGHDQVPAVYDQTLGDFYFRPQ